MRYYQPPRRDVILVELDGVLADDSHRRVYEQDPVYNMPTQNLDLDTYFDPESMIADPANDMIVEMLRARKRTAYIFVLATRPIWCHEVTRKWLKDSALVPDRLFMGVDDAFDTLDCLTEGFDPHTREGLMRLANGHPSILTNHCQRVLSFYEPHSHRARPNMLALVRNNTTAHNFTFLGVDTLVMHAA